MSTTGKPLRILVLDADVVPALAVTRSLAGCSYQVIVASAQEAPLASFSRRVAACWRYPDPLLDEQSFLDWLENHLAHNRYDLVIPVTERTLVPLSAHRERFVGTRIAMAERASLDRVLDKAETFRLAQSLGVPVPESVYLTAIDQLGEYAPGLSYPVVVKPSRSVSAADTGYSRRNVSYANTEPELRQQCEACLLHCPVILQSYFHGVGAGIELIARDGEILYPFQHVRLHEVPLSGGGSSFRVSAAIEPALLQAAEALVRALQWNGVAMVEFKWNPDSGKFCLMEINGRFWGSLPLALAAGADFPAMLAELSISGGLGEYPPYRRGVYCRNLASDLMWHELVLRGGKGTGPASVPSMGLLLRDLARLFSPRHHFDTQSLVDPLPGLVDLKRVFARQGGRLRDLVANKALALQQRLLWRNGTVRERLREAKTVVFICYGNINRSAVAEVVMQNMLPADSGKRILSAGFHRQEGRPADSRMQKIGRERGFDLSRCSSVRFSDELIQNSDIIFVMEMKHRDDLLSEYPSAANKTFLLGPGCREAGRGATEIADPYNRSEDAYRACFAQIYRAVAGLNDAIRADYGK